eukprot:TRINITY_DN8290_c0_g3_i1.p1 TRINITY_DN8290_c0_g3~~TRINITY_DN8290_c0_g3_i1.p1  ORF type:complete len:346 (+),score=56.72 TRINITY_DN8290_c0_g3_i1:85-1038(+)
MDQAVDTSNLMEQQKQWCSVLSTKTLPVIDDILDDDFARELFHSVRRAVEFEHQWNAAQTEYDSKKWRVDEDLQHAQWMRVALRLAGAARSYKKFKQRTEILTQPVIEIVLRDKNLFGDAQLSSRIKPEAVIARSDHSDRLCLYLAGLVSETKSLRGWQGGFVGSGYSTQWILDTFSAAFSNAIYYRLFGQQIPQIHLRCLRSISHYVHFADASFPSRYFQDLMKDPRVPPDVRPMLISTGAADHPSVMSAVEQSVLKGSRRPLGWNVMKPHDLVQFVMHTAMYLQQQLQLPPSPVLDNINRLIPDDSDCGQWAILR